jgi:hypothetical protein
MPSLPRLGPSRAQVVAARPARKCAAPQPAVYEFIVHRTDFPRPMGWSLKISLIASGSLANICATIGASPIVGEVTAAPWCRRW